MRGGGHLSPIARKANPASALSARFDTHLGQVLVRQQMQLSGFEAVLAFAFVEKVRLEFPAGVFFCGRHCVWPGLSRYWTTWTDSDRVVIPLAKLGSSIQTSKELQRVDSSSNKQRKKKLSPKSVLEWDLNQNMYSLYRLSVAASHAVLSSHPAGPVADECLAGAPWPGHHNSGEGRKVANILLAHQRLPDR